MKCVCVCVPQSAAELADALKSGGGFEAAIGRFDSNFSSMLLDLLDKLSIYSTNDCEHSMINIIYRWGVEGVPLKGHSTDFL